MHPLNAKLDATYWDNRYITGEDGWDIGHVSKPLQAYFDQLSDKSKKILIPGCGRGHEAAYLVSMGFDSVTLLDFSPVVVHELKKKFEGTSVKVFEADVFSFTGKYDIIVEQTMFCALEPTLRKAYVAKIHELLAEDGKFVGILFASQFDQPGPPFGGQKSEYLSLFQEKFHIHAMEICYNSINPRNGNELWINMSPKK